MRTPASSRVVTRHRLWCWWATYTVNGLRQVFIAGADLTSAALRFDLLVLAAFAVFFATIAALTIRRDVV